MSKRTRWIALALCALMAVSLVACSGGDSGNTPSASQTPTQTSAGTPTDAPTPTDGDNPYAEYEPDPGTTYTISWYTNEPNAPCAEDGAIKLILEETFNVKFDMWYVDRANREELLSVRFASGEFPDVLTATSPTYTQAYYKQGLTAELPVGLIEHFMPTIAQCIQDVTATEGVSPYIYSTYEGKNIGLPNFNYAGQYHYTSLLRSDWLDALGITKTPETIEELNTAFYALKDNKQALIDAGLTTQSADNIYGLSSGRIKEPFASIYGAYGSIPYYWEMSDNNESIQYGAIQPGMRDALEQLAQWYADGILNPEYITGENRGDHWSISHDFVEGRILYTNNGPFYQNMPAGVSIATPKGGRMYRAYIAAENTPESYEVGRPPVGPKGDSGSIIWGLSTGESVTFSQRLENDKQKYGKILSFLEASCTTTEYWELQTYGVEGVHWEYNDEGVRSTEGLIPSDVPVETYGLNMVFNGWAEGMGLCVVDDPPYYAYGDEVARYSNNYKDVLLGMTMPSSDIYWDELEKLRVQVYNDIIQGYQGIEAFDQFVIDWKAKGGDIITQEANDWYNTSMGN